jgi:RimJ/RimL family protein N-acetyltransferase
MATSKFPPTVETERLILRAPSVAEAHMVNAAICQSFTELHRWMKWANKIPTLEETIDHALKTSERFQAGEDFPVWGFLKKANEFVVGCGLHRIDWEVPKFEIGYWCCTSFQRQGYVTEAVKALTRIGFDQLGANRIEIRCDSRNQRSYRIAERTGFQLEAKLKNEQRAPDGILRTTLIYVIFPDEYRNSPIYFGES